MHTIKKTTEKNSSKVLTPGGIHIDFSKSADEIIQDIKIFYIKSGMDEKNALEIAKKLCPPFLKCPWHKKRLESPVSCMFCHYGHMTECHYPLTCDAAACGHYDPDMEAF